MANPTRREFLKIGLAAAGGALAASAIEIPIFNNQNTSIQNQLNSANTQVTNLQNRVSAGTGFVWLNNTERVQLEAIVETIIPTDSTGPGAKEAGVIYFIDRQLAGDYGLGGNMFMEGPFIPPNFPKSTTTPLTVNPSPAWAALPGNTNAPIQYTDGTANVRVGAGTRYQYPLIMREFWKAGLAAIQTYSNTAPYTANFEKLSATNQLQVLKDLWNNVPTQANFNNIIPSDFAYELTFMTWAGFLMDPIYGGNRDMVGWTYTGFNGVNLGNFYGEGKDQRTLMLATSPTRLKPASLAQYQQQINAGGP